MPIKGPRHTTPCAHHKSRCRKSKVKFSKRKTRPAVCPPCYMKERRQKTKPTSSPFHDLTTNTKRAKRVLTTEKRCARKWYAKLFLETATHVLPPTGNSQRGYDQSDRQKCKQPHSPCEHGALRHHNNGAPQRHRLRPERPEHTTKVPICGVANSYFFQKTVQK